MSENKNAEFEYSVDDLKKAMETIGLKESDIDSVIKSVNSEEEAENTDLTKGMGTKKAMDSKEEEGEDDKEENEEEEETEKVGKSCMKKSITSEIEDLEKSLTAKKQELESIEKSETPTENKSESMDIFKGMVETLNSLNQTISAQRENETNLQKSISNLNERFEAIEKSINEFGSTPTGYKSIPNSAILSKSIEEETGENGKKLLSISRNKTQVEQYLEKGMDALNDGDILKSAYEKSLVNYNAGGGQIAQEVINDLSKSYDVDLIK
jgi:chromosome segregation ATPase